MQKKAGPVPAFLWAGFGARCGPENGPIDCSQSGQHAARSSERLSDAI